MTLQEVHINSATQPQNIKVSQVMCVCLANSKQVAIVQNFWNKLKRQHLDNIYMK